ncbi:hypothetical protein ACFOHK_04290 [Falsigemmobacter intermedius]|uniref:Glycosyl transferase family 2 n=1 Tax=Falsigemmobacter intermedius TaxID=1553448 RepID=A0A444MEF1_9RHOB|nr:hypothetical protein [Falsigemmobacter intermedius]RWY43268.1 hypothetical protein EP867_04985 [Falsigemmobacter intermedius]
MIFDGMDHFLAAHAADFRSRPAALVFAEDAVELASTLQHLSALGFGQIAVLCDDLLVWPEEAPSQVHRIRGNIFQEDALSLAVNRMIAAAPGAWLHYCYNGEYLHYPFCETRSVLDVCTFQSEERRDTIVTPVVDLYAADTRRQPDGVDRATAMLDRIGYYALQRGDPLKNWEPKPRQFDLFGGLRWRFEEHVPWTKRRIDRVSLFRAVPGLIFRQDHSFNIEEYNTLNCPWHHNLSGAVCSFRTAKALRINPGSREAIHSFAWAHSVPFEWSSRQLMELGLMEPGQWF